MSRWFALLVCVVACADSPPPADCPADEPESCPAAGGPSYATDIAPLIMKYCTNECHNPSGSASDQPMSTYHDLQLRAGDAHGQLYDCKMPMAPAPDPTLAERVTLLTWFVCGAPNN